MLCGLSGSAYGSYVRKSRSRLAFSGRACAVLGTHTHIPTADEQILEPGTAYWTDAGMCGAYQSVLGRCIEPVIASFVDGRKRRFAVAEQDLRLSGCCIQIQL